MKTLEFLLFSLLSISLYSQKAELIGVIVSGDDHLPIPFANIVCKDSIHKILAGTSSKMDGTFILPLDFGKYQMVISFLGYKTITKEITITQDTDIGFINMEKERLSIKEVTLLGKKKLFKKEGGKTTIFEVSKNPVLVGKNVSNVIDFIPGIIKNNDGINLLGYGEPVVFVDGLRIPLSGEELLNYLKTIPTSTVEKIEHNTISTAKHDADSNGGVINITLKNKTDRGIKNSFLTSIYADEDFKYYSLDNNFSYKIGKLQSLLNFGLAKGYLGDESVIETFHTGKSIHSHSKRKIDKDKTNWQLQAKYTFNSNINAEVFYIGSLKNANSLHSIFNEFKFKNSINSNYNTSNTIFFNPYTVNHLASFKLENNMNEFGLITFSSSYFKQNNNTDIGSELESNKNIFSSIINQYISNYIVKLDYSLPLQFVKLSSGFKINGYKIKSDYSEFKFEKKSFFRWYNSSEHTYSLYVNGFKEITHKLNVRIGFRYENTKLDSESAELLDYWRIFPSFSLQYTFSPKNMVFIKYGRRVKRPSFLNLTPYVYDINEVTTLRGNPDLKPYLLDAIDLGHDIKNLSYGVFLTNSHNRFNDVFELNKNEKKTIITKRNFYNLYLYGLKLNYSKSVSWLHTVNGFQLFLNQSNLTNKKDQIKLYSPSSFLLLYSRNNISINNKINLSVNFDYISGGAMALFHAGTRYGLHFGITYRINEKLNMSASINDIFNTDNQNNFLSTINNIERIYSSNKTKRLLSFSLSYIFGLKKIKSKKRLIKNFIEKDRI